MKTLILILSSIVLVTIIGCSSLVPTTNQPARCNCGVVVEDDGYTDGYYWIYMQNDCTKNIKKFYVNEDVWYRAGYGATICFKDGQTW